MPSERSPAGLANRAVCSWPSWVGFAWPGSVALSTPSWPTVMLSAPSGMESAGSIGNPSDVTTRFCPSSLKLPARVNAVEPSGRDT